MIHHHAAHMSEMQGGTQRLGEGIGRIDDARDGVENDIAIGFPLLNHKMLYVDVARSWGRAAGIDHKDGRLVVLVEHSRTRLDIFEFIKDRSHVLGNLGSLNCSDEFSVSGARGDGRLHIGLVGNGTTTKHEGEASDRSASGQV